MAHVEGGREIPVNIVGSSTFGRYPKISLEKTLNMFISDGALVNYAGYKKLLDFIDNDSGGRFEGRGVFVSARNNVMVAVAGGVVYIINSDLGVEKANGATLETFTGEVSMDENLRGQICIVDGVKAYILNVSSRKLTKQSLSFTPSYVSFHGSYFLFGSGENSTNPHFWYAFSYSTDDTIAQAKQLSIQTKPDIALAVKRLPGRGNNVAVLGRHVGEIWTLVGGTDIYRRVSSTNFDTGCISVNTIAASDKFLAWLGISETNSPVIMVTDGTTPEAISTDGINFRLQTVKVPGDSTALFFKQDGHLFYQLTFFNEADNFTMIYDFKEKKFYDLSDENKDYHPAIQVGYFRGGSYFVSKNDAGLYEIGSKYDTYQYNLNRNVIRVVKGSSGAIQAGQAVYFSGDSAARSVKEVELAKADSSDTMDAVGLVESTLTDKSQSNIVIKGKVKNLNTGVAYGDADTVLVNASNETANLSQGGAGSVNAFAADNDTLTIGATDRFKSIYFDVNRNATTTIIPTFEYSTGVGTWAEFKANEQLSDGTSGFTQSGFITWCPEQLKDWVRGTGNEYLIRITRTSDSISLFPIFDLVQVPQASGWSEGDDLYISPFVPGQLTNTAPTGSNIVQKIGYVVKLDNDAGVIAVTNGSIGDATLNMEGEVIPRMRICKTIRQPSSDRFRVSSMQVFIEQGDNNFHTPADDYDTPALDFSFSKNGNRSFTLANREVLNDIGYRRNKVSWHRLGIANEFTPKFDFIGWKRFVAVSAMLEVF